MDTGKCLCAGLPDFDSDEPIDCRTSGDIHMLCRLFDNEFAIAGGDLKPRTLLNIPARDGHCHAISRVVPRVVSGVNQIQLDCQSVLS